MTNAQAQAITLRILVITSFVVSRFEVWLKEHFFVYSADAGPRINHRYSELMFESANIELLFSDFMEANDNLLIFAWEFESILQQINYDVLGSEFVHHYDGFQLL